MWSAGRSLSLLDPTYASKYIPIIASVSEHQPPAWNSYFTDVHILVLLAPLGLIACFRPMTDASLFLILYGVTAVYFSGVMVGCLGMFPMLRLELSVAVQNSKALSGVGHEVIKLLCAFCICCPALVTLQSSVAVSHCCLLPLLTPSSAVRFPHKSCPQTLLSPP